MNILLKYFIYFLLGIIIYYFLFNSPNVGAKKLIEGFNQGLIDNSNKIFLKSKYALTVSSDGATKSLAVGLDGGVTYRDGPDTVYTPGSDGRYTTPPEGDDILTGQIITISDAISDAMLTTTITESSFIDPNSYFRNRGQIVDMTNITSTELIEIASSSTPPLNPIALQIGDFDDTISLRYGYVNEGGSDGLSGDQLIFTKNNGVALYAISDINNTFETNIRGILPNITDANTVIYGNVGELTSYLSYFMIHIPQQVNPDGGDPIQGNLLSENPIILFVTNDETISDEFATNHNGEANAGRVINTAVSVDYKVFKYQLSDLGELSDLVFNILRTKSVSTESDKKTFRIELTISGVTNNFTGDFRLIEGILTNTGAQIHYIDYVNKYRSLLDDAEAPSDPSVVDANTINNSLVLLADIMGTDNSGSFGGDLVGCNETVCTNENLRLQALGMNNVTYHGKTTPTAAGLTCSPAQPGTPAYEAAGSAPCTPQTCCYDISCMSNFFAKGGNCGNKQILGSATCDVEGGDAADCENHCCGESISGVLRQIFNSIKRFRSTIIGGDGPPGARKIYLKDIIYYIYNSTLDLETMLTDGITFEDTTIQPMFTNGVPNENHTYGNYALLTQYFESAFTQETAESGISGNVYNMSNDYGNVLSSISLKSGIFDGASETVGAFITRLSGIMDFRGGGKTLETITGNFGNYLSFYEDYTAPADEVTGGDTGIDNAHGNLENDLKHAIMKITVNSPNAKDGGGTGFSKPISLFSLGSSDYRTKTISLSEFQLYL